jgi:hypothetical protein
MQIQDYFNFLAPDDIRIKGSRIGIESVLYEYIYRAKTPEEIAQQFETITLEDVYATKHQEKNNCIPSSSLCKGFSKSGCAIYLA